MDYFGADEIYRDGKHYDALNNFDYDVLFYLDLASIFGNPILDLGCGTGRITIPLGLKGYNITGLDFSETMLEEAKFKAELQNLNINFIRGDFRNFSIDSKFELILMTFNSICHLYDFNSIVSCFKSVINHLTPSGRFIIDVANPDLTFLTRGKEKVTTRASYKNPYSDGIVKLNQSNHFDKVLQINFNKWYFDIDGKEIEQELNKRIFFPQEIDNYLRFMGFEIENKFGNFDKCEFAADSPKQIIVAKKI
jgi:SAM-dependent methyltransferase